MAPTRTPKAKQEDQPRFACPQCDSTFGRKHDVKRHEQGIHNGIRFYCSEPGCSFSAGQRTGLDTHMNKHTGKTPFVCPECPVAYKDRSSLSRHKQNKHGHIPYHTPAWHEKQARKSARASPYDVSAPAARGTARAKKAAAASDAASSSASSGQSSSPSSLNSDFSAPAPPPVTPSSDSSDFSSILAFALSYNSSPSSSSSAGSEFSPPTPALSSTFDASDFSSSPISSVAFTDFHDLKEDASAFNPSNSTPGYTPQDLAVAQCSLYLVQDPTYGYKHAGQQKSADYHGLQTPALPMQDYTGYLDDVNSQLFYDADAFNPAWGLPGGSAFWGQQSQYSPPQPLYQDTAIFQPTPDFYGGALPQETTYAIPPFEPLSAILTHEQYAPSAVEQPAPASMLCELEPRVNDTVEQRPLWAKFNMTRRQQLARFAF